MRQTVGQKTNWAKPLIIPGNPDSSHLVLTIRQSRSTIMPPSPLPALPDTEVNKIADWIKQGAKGPGGKKFPTYREGKLYVVNSADGRVDVIDLSTNYKVDSISTVLSGENPTIVQTHHIAVSPDKKNIYVTNAWAFGHIVKIDADADSVISRVRAGYQPSDIVISPDGQFVYTTDYNLGIPGTSVVRKTNTQTMTVVVTFSVSRAPHGIAISRNGQLVLTPGELSSDCWFIYPDGDSLFRLKLWPGAANPVVAPDSVYRPFGILFSKNDGLAFISCIKNNQIRMVNAFTRSPADIDSILLDPVTGKNPYMLALTDDGNTLYAACWGSNTVAVIDLLTDSVSSYIPVGLLPHAPALVADSLLYVTCEGNHVTPYKVYVVNTITKTVVDSIDVGRYPNGIAVLKP